MFSAMYFSKGSLFLKDESGLQHGDLDAMFFSCVDSFLVTRVHVAHNAHAGISGEHTLDASSGFRRAICHDDLTSVLTETDAYAAAMMERDPGGAANRIDQRV